MIIHERQTDFGYLTVEDLGDGVRGVFIDGVCQGRAKGKRFVPYSWYLKQIDNKVGNIVGAKTALVLGGGAGIITSAIDRYGIKTDTIEQSRAMVETAIEYFDFRPKGNVIIGNAFDKVSTVGRYDIIVYDLFNGLTPPDGPEEFIDEVLSHLNRDGHFFANVLRDKKQYILELTSDS